LLLGGALAGSLFTLVWFVEGIRRPGYEPTRHPISALSLGESGWIQIANFIVTGLLTVALALGVWKANQGQGASMWEPILLGIVGLGFLGTGFFVTDPMNGYPPGTPPVLLPPTATGVLHVLFASLIFGLPSACFVFARRFDKQGERHWALYSRVTAISFIIVYLIGMAGFLQAPGLVNAAGLYQRISVSIGLAWMTLLPIHLLKQTNPRPASARQ
jgi:hypothetical protein